MSSKRSPTAPTWRGHSGSQRLERRIPASRGGNDWALWSGGAKWHFITRAMSSGNVPLVALVAVGWDPPFSPVPRVTNSLRHCVPWRDGGWVRSGRARRTECSGWEWQPKRGRAPYRSSAQANPIPRLLAEPLSDEETGTESAPGVSGRLLIPPVAPARGDSYLIAVPCRLSGTLAWEYRAPGPASEPWVATPGYDLVPAACCRVEGSDGCLLPYPTSHIPQSSRKALPGVGTERTGTHVGSESQSTAGRHLW